MLGHFEPRTSDLSSTLPSVGGVSHGEEMSKISREEESVAESGGAACGSEFPAVS
jgi:hypothetical protein